MSTLALKSGPSQKGWRFWLPLVVAFGALILLSKCGEGFDFDLPDHRGGGSVGGSSRVILGPF